MSVSLSISYKEASKKEQLVPIATEKLFESYWQPIAIRLDSHWIPLFQTGLPVSNEDLPEIMGELRAMESWLCSKIAANTSDEVYTHILKRLTTLIEKLDFANNNPDIQELYIG